MAVHHFAETQLPQQRNYNFIPFPSFLSPNSTTITLSVACSVSHLTETIKSQKQFLDSLLHKTGAILFRGFDAKTAEDFNNVVKAFGYEEFLSFGATALRTQVFDRVYTANNSPPDQMIGFHHEMAQEPQFPSKLFFFCEVEPASGGETPIVLSHIVCEKIQEKYPKFVEKLEEHGLIFTRFLGDNDNPSSLFGRSWKSIFSTEDRKAAEERAAKIGNRLEWKEGGGVKRTIGPLPVTHYDKSRQRKIWFTSMIGWESAGNDRVNTITFGDSKSLPTDHCYECLRILENESVAIPWQKGDVLLIDNLAVLHARRPSKPPRHILVSLCKLEWKEGGGVKRTIGHLPVTHYDKSKQRKIWFTSMISWESARNDHVNTITFGDGKSLPADHCYKCLRILEKESVAIPWQKGDVLLIDNWAMLHARRPSKPPRRILVSLCK